MELTELAQNYFGDTRSGSLAGPVGGFIIAALAVTTVLLIRNMNARLRRLPERFPSDSGTAAAGSGAAAGPQSAAGTAEPASAQAAQATEPTQAAQPTSPRAADQQRTVDPLGPGPRGTGADAPQP